MILYKTINSMALSESTNVSNPYEILQECKDGYLDDISSINFEILTEGVIGKKMEVLRKSLGALKKFIRDMIEKMKLFVRDLIGKMSRKKKEVSNKNNKKDNDDKKEEDEDEAMVDWVDYELVNALTPAHIVKTLISTYISGDYLYDFDEIKKEDIAKIISRVNDIAIEKVTGPYKNSQTTDFKKLCYLSFRKSEPKQIAATDEEIAKYKNFDGTKLVNSIMNDFVKNAQMVDKEIDNTIAKSDKISRNGDEESTEAYGLYIHAEVLKNIASLIFISSTEHVPATRAYVKQVNKLKELELWF